MPFAASMPQDKGTAAQVQEMVVRLLSSRSDIELVDRSKDTMVLKELNNQMREVSVSAKVLADQGKLSGAKEIIVGTLTKAGADDINSSNTGLLGNNDARYSGIVSYSLQLIDVETGTLKEQGIFNGNTNNTDATNKAAEGLKSLFGRSKLANATDATSGVVMADTKEKAILNAIRSSEKPLIEWINGLYPPDIKILAVEKRAKGLPETVLVAGLGPNLKKGTQITISEIQFIDLGNGKKAKQVKKVGELKVQELQGEITLCKVTDGESVLEDKMKGSSKLAFAIK